MPIYTFRNKNTGEEYTEMMSIAAKETYLIENKDIEQAITVPHFVDPVTVGAKKPPVDFQKHVLSRVKNVPGADKNRIEKRWTIPKEV